MSEKQPETLELRRNLGPIPESDAPRPKKRQLKLGLPNWINKTRVTMILILSLTASTGILAYAYAASVQYNATITKPGAGGVITLQPSSVSIVSFTINWSSFMTNTTLRFANTIPGANATGTVTLTVLGGSTVLQTLSAPYFLGDGITKSNMASILLQSSNVLLQATQINVAD